jgi:hypothetical protein
MKHLVINKKNKKTNNMIDNSTKMALSLALVGAGLKYYAAHSTTLAADKKPQTNTIGDYALYSGLGLAVLFHFIK